MSKKYWKYECICFRDSSDEEEKWITINGQHIKVDENGEPINPPNWMKEGSGSSGNNSKTVFGLNKIEHVNYVLSVMEKTGLSKSDVESEIKNSSSEDLEKNIKAFKENYNSRNSEVKTKASEEGEKINPKSLSWNKHDEFKTTSIKIDTKGYDGLKGFDTVHLRISSDGTWKLECPMGTSKTEVAEGEGGEKEAFGNLPDFVKQIKKHAFSGKPRGQNLEDGELIGISSPSGGRIFSFKNGEKAETLPNVPENMHKDFTSTGKKAKEEQESKKSAGRNYLNVPFAQKEEAKKHGAKWDSDKKKWYIAGDIPEKLKKFSS